MEITHPVDQKNPVTVILPDDIMCYNILPRVPLVSLLRFKYVSKEWSNLTKNPTFIDFYQNHTLDTHDYSDSLVVCVGLDTKGCRCLYTYLDASHALAGRSLVIQTQVADDTRIAGSCNGFICLVSGDKGRVALCNPLTREFRWLLNPPTVQSIPVPHSVYGFGYDFVSHDYKIARIIVSEVWNRSCSIIQVYSTSTESWRETKVSFDFYHIFELGACLNNTLHWTVFNSGACCYGVMMFDLRTEEFGKMQLPNEMEFSVHFVCTLAVSGGLLYSLWSNKASSKYSIWVMKKYGVSESWTELYNLKGGDLNLKYGVLSNYRSKIGGGGGGGGGCGGKVLMIEHAHHHPNELAWYNCADKSTEKLDVHDNRSLIGQPWLCSANIARIPGL